MAGKHEIPNEPPAPSWSMKASLMKFGIIGTPQAHHSTSSGIVEVLSHFSLRSIARKRSTGLAPISQRVATRYLSFSIQKCTHFLNLNGEFSFKWTYAWFTLPPGWFLFGSGKCTPKYSGILIFSSLANFPIAPATAAYSTDV